MSDKEFMEVDLDEPMEPIEESFEVDDILFVGERDRGYDYWESRSSRTISFRGTRIA